MDDYSKLDCDIWAYINLALQLKEKKRKGVGTMFRHQLETFTILLEYGYKDRILLKASILHDFIEDGPDTRKILSEQIRNVDKDGGEVFNLVNEMTIREKNGREEPKGSYLTRIMTRGSRHARVLKLADRISNVASLAVINNTKFIRRYLEETTQYILPYARKIDIKMYDELEELIALKTKILV